MALLLSNEIDFNLPDEALIFEQNFDEDHLKAKIKYLDHELCEKNNLINYIITEQEMALILSKQVISLNYISTLLCKV